MDDLIARLESAPAGGSRELDEAIATRVWGEPRPSGNAGGPRTLVWWHNGVGRSVAPEFTLSLDAALTLVVSERLPLTIEWAGGSREWPLVTLGHETAQAKNAASSVCIVALKVQHSDVNQT